MLYFRHGNNIPKLTEAVVTQARPVQDRTINISWVGEGDPGAPPPLPENLETVGDSCRKCAQ